MGTYQGNELTCNSSGNIWPQLSELTEPLWTDPGVKSRITVHVDHYSAPSCIKIKHDLRSVLTQTFNAYTDFSYFSVHCSFCDYSECTERADDSCFRKDENENSDTDFFSMILAK